MIKLAKVKAEWEKSLLIAVVSVLLLCLAIFFWPRNSEGTVNQPAALPAKPDYVDVNSDFWLKPTFLDSKISILTFSRAVPVPPAPDPPPPRPGQTTPSTPSTGDTVSTPSTGGTASTPFTGGQTPPPPGPPKTDPPPRGISVVYRGMYQGLSDQRLAFIKASDSSTKKSISVPLGESEKIFSALTVVSFDENSLTITYGEGKKVVVKRGSEKKVKLQ